MKFLHVADLHLGKRVNGFEMLADQRAMLEQLLGLCRANGADAILLAGDIYDTTVPPAGAVVLFDEFLTGCVQAGIAVLAVSGNHDSAERLDYGHSLFAHSGVHIAGRFTGAPVLVTLTDAEGPVDFYLLPFVKAATVAHFLPDADISDYDTAVAAALAAAAPDPARRSVLVAHQFVTAGAALPQAAGSEAAFLNVGTVDNVDAARFAAFDYVALGHIHRPQRVGRDTVRYAGSPLAYSLEECGAEKSAVLVELGVKGALSFTALPLTPPHPMRHLTGTLAELCAAPPCADYLWATLTDPTPLPDAMARLRTAYPNAMKLDYTATFDGESAARGAQAVRTKSFEELFGDFFETMQGRAPDPEELAELAAMKEEAGL